MRGKPLVIDARTPSLMYNNRYEQKGMVGLMSKKRVYAALQIGDREVRLLVYEVFDGRFNVLRVEHMPHQGVKDQKIVDESAVVKAIQKAASNAQASLGYRIERVLLVIPGLNITRSAKKVKVALEEGSRSVRLFHVQQGYSTARDVPAPEGTELIMTARTLYSVNGQETRKLPVGEECDEFEMTTDLIYGDRDLLYSYARAVEQSNMEVLDISLDAQNAAQETTALQLSDDRPVIQLLVEPDHTSLAFFTGGRLMTVSSLPTGYMHFIQSLQRKYDLSDAVAWRLLQNIFSMKMEENSDITVYIEQRGDERIEISADELAKAAVPRIRQWVREINDACEPLLGAGKVRYIVSGEGANIPVMAEAIADLNAESQLYLPTTIGARSGSYVPLLGAGYSFQEQNRIQHNERNSVNANQLEASLESIRRHDDREEGSFTRKLKNVILQAE